MDLSEVEKLVIPATRYQNLRDAIAYFNRQPDETIYPGLVLYFSDCGTLACFGGHAMRCLGISRTTGSLEALERALNISEYEREHVLCAPRGGVGAERVSSGLTDKQIVNLRVREFLKSKGEFFESEYTRGIVL